MELRNRHGIAHELTYLASRSLRNCRVLTEVLLVLDLEGAMRRWERLLGDPRADVGTCFRFGDAMLTVCCGGAEVSGE